MKNYLPFVHMKLMRTLFSNKLTFILLAMRVHRPVGTFLLFWPSLWGLFLSQPKGFPVQARHVYILLAGSFLMRSAGCLINDYIDKNIDQKVPRTRNRPFAAGKLGVYDFYIATATLLMLASTLLLFLPAACTKLALLAAVLVFAYPFMKRFTAAPQVFLAFTMNYGMLMGYCAGGGEMGLGLVPLWLMYLAAAFWTLGYDTIYALNDAPYDRALGLGSTAILFEKHPQAYIGTCYGCAIGFSWLALAPLSLLSQFCFAGYALGLMGQVVALRYEVGADKLFQANIMTGALLTAAVLWR